MEAPGSTQPSSSHLLLLALLTLTPSLTHCLPARLHPCPHPLQPPPCKPLDTMSMVDRGYATLGATIATMSESDDEGQRQALAYYKKPFEVGGQGEGG